MPEPRILVAGATGDLGGRITREAAGRGAAVRALVRPGSTGQKIDILRDLGVEVFPADYWDPVSLAKSCEGVTVVVSALAGLRDVVVDAQTQLLNAAVRAGVPRFIPSDYAIDFTQIPEGWNRNLNLRNEFRKRVDAAKIQATSILNGAFTEMLTGTAPFILFKQKRILCWGDQDQLMDWTTIADTASYTAAAALDSATPRFLKIAGDQLSARTLATTVSELTGERFEVLRPGGPGVFRMLIRVTKLFTPKSNSLYPPWQGMQYMHNMYAGIAKFDRLDNDRYPMEWASVKDVLRRHLAGKYKSK